MSEPIELEEEEGSAYTISAKVVDVPLEVLPGRQKEFRNFIGKVCFFSQIFILELMDELISFFFRRLYLDPRQLSLDF